MLTQKLTKKLALITAAGAICAQASADEPTISGSLSLDFNSHFMSYGADVWGAGSDADILFEPSFGVNLDFGNGFGVYTGVWFDINDQATSTIGGDFQEIDVWVGAYYSFDMVTVDVTFQQWYYGGETEGIVDVTLGFDVMLAPYIKAHTRTESVGNGSNGTVLEIGAGYDIPDDDYAIDFSIPFAVGFFLDEDFQGGDDTFGYANIGLSFSYALGGIPEGLGAWDIHGGATLWHTPDGAVPGNPDETFVTFSLGVGVGF